MRWLGLWLALVFGAVVIGESAWAAPAGLCQKGSKKKAKKKKKKKAAAPGAKSEDDDWTEGEGGEGGAPADADAAVPGEAAQDADAAPAARGADAASAAKDAAPAAKGADGAPAAKGADGAPDPQDAAAGDAKPRGDAASGAAARAVSAAAPGARKASTVVPGSVSRWSNAGAMEPIVTEVEITAPLPERAVPLLPGQATPGQRLDASGERLSAHLSFFGEHSETVRQDASDLNLFRGRASLDYDRIADSDFGLHLDLEYRGSAGARRLTDRKINALYASWGATDFRRDDGPAFGVALGRVAVREAGYSQIDGAALRLRLTPSLKLGVYGGLTGNPYNYNWRLAATEDFSTGWVGGGVFGALRAGPFFADFAAGTVLATFPGGGLDRLFLYLDAGWAVSDAVDLFLSGWFDVVAGTPVQNVELLASIHPSRELHLRLSAARYASLIYAFATNYSFRFDPTGATYPGGKTIVDAAGAPIVSYDAVSLQAVYDSLGARLGYRVWEVLEPYVALDVELREPSGDGAVDFAALRLLPAAGLTYRDPEVLEVTGQVLGIVDAQTDRKLVLQLSVARELAGLRVGADVRGFLGGSGAADGGLELSYTLPREWMPGRLMVRSMLRYTREGVTIARPPDQCLAPVPAPGCDLLTPDAVLPLVPTQETVYGFAGVDWRF